MHELFHSYALKLTIVFIYLFTATYLFRWRKTDAHERA